MLLLEGDFPTPLETIFASGFTWTIFMMLSFHASISLSFSNTAIAHDLLFLVLTGLVCVLES